MSDSNPDISLLSLDHLKGVAAKQCEKLSRLDIYNLQDLLFHFPLRYEDRTHLVEIAALTPDMECVIEGEIVLSEVIRRRKPMLICRLQDKTGNLDLRFFNFYPSQQRQLSNGARVRCFGQLKRGQQRLEMVHPDFEVLNDESPPVGEDSLTPVYPTTEGLGQKTISGLVNQALMLLNTENLRELISPDLLATQGLPAMPLMDAIKFIHHPPPQVDQWLLSEGQHPCQLRLVVEELLAHQLAMFKVRQQNLAHRACSMPLENPLISKFLAALAFSPTGAQSRVYQEITRDLNKSSPMMRLVQGDVGSGKTLVAALAALQVLACDQQVALMAPTELLAEQHAKTFYDWLEPLGVSVAWLSGKVTGKARKQVLKAIAEGEALMIVGTHALFQQAVEFDRLSLIIVDEQHRFGVHQRLTLREKGSKNGYYPHQLIMTATPIPRTLAMSAYADLDCSVIDELPPGRTPVTTVALSDNRRQELIGRVRSTCQQQQRQVYWVCTLIEESEHLQCQAAEDTHLLLTEQLDELTIGLIHGRMKSQEKLQIMQQFKTGAIDVLVATTVIEVGVDVPNASLMVIENAERLGLAQLHQLRGRVGRGSIASHCVLFYHSPLSHHGKQRIAALRETNDGFLIAEKDLELRGPGEVLGTRQTGVAEFKMADLYQHRALLPKANELAKQIAQHYPESSKLLIERWLGDKEEFAKV